MSTEQVKDVLDKNRNLKKVTFSCGEPTLNPDLISWIRYAKAAGYSAINLVTNGRRLSYSDYAKALLSSGITELTISIHSHDSRVHDALTRSQSFIQAREGLQNTSRFKGKARLKINVTVTRLNMEFRDIYRFLSGYCVDSINFNVVKPQGRADRNADMLLPEYTGVVEAFNRFYDTYDRRIPVSLSGIPRCIHLKGGEYEKMRIFYGGEHMDNEEFEDRFKADGCCSCMFTNRCNGIWKRYADIYGTGEFIPFTRQKVELMEDPIVMMPIMAVRSGLKPAARIEHLREEDIESVKSLIHKHGLMMRMLKGSQSFDPVSARFDKDGRLKFSSILISTDQKILDRLHEATIDEKQNRDSVCIAGNLLGYPKCCTESFSKIAYEDDRTTNLMLLERTEGRPHWLLNNLLNPYRLVEFFPCSYGCQHAIDYARKMLDVLGDSAGELEAHLKRPVLYCDFNDYISFEGEVKDGIVHYSDFNTSFDYSADFMAPGNHDMIDIMGALGKGNRLFIDGKDIIIFMDDKMVSRFLLKNEWRLFDFG